ncbi:TetR family transcriptional regulator [Epidermidibacterium keratini]|uniref:TetR family transcriptional regulator n=1 Tax=Epidermidibacterium keratini TaxID=1891644 RepID=A0A7L4YN58_9ACTN|nr:TetR/AcrR family transcriptional regulator [Epidermidibacterium keratini]QHC00323.1 TetR family transcriptional regulator [Epidermidibacterium keratini]
MTATTPDQSADAAAPTTERGRRKRAAIVSAARAVFEDAGFKDARIADIAKRAGASYGSFYTYFESKDEIFREVVQDVTDEMFETSRSGSGTIDPVERIEIANRKYVEAYARNARMMSVMAEVSAYDDFTGAMNYEIRKRFVDRNAAGIRRLQASGEADPKIDAEIAADVLGGMIERFAQVWVPRRTPEEIEAAVPVLTSIWARGIGLQG